MLSRKARKNAKYNILVPTILALLLLLLTFTALSLLSSASVTTYATNIEKSPARINNTSISTRLVDPNPYLVDAKGQLKKNFSSIEDINSSPVRNGTIADGVSKLILVLDSSSTLRFSINNTNPNNITNGTLGSLNQSSNANSSTTTVSPQKTSDGRSVVVAVYTPPDFMDLDERANHTTIKVLVNDAQAISIDLYRVPIVLVHGLWGNANETWNKGKINFTSSLIKAGYNVSFADYGAYNSRTFDPYAISNIGNYGIDAIRKVVNNTLNDYRNNLIAASQVDVIAHSMGGLMARGFTQQPDYKNESNFMSGYIHRLITIGTPHFGGQLAEILYNHRDNWYCFDLNAQTIVFPTLACQFDFRNFEFMPLKTIYTNKYNASIDKGGVEALIPGSIAYSHLCQSNVTSYAIGGSWAPSASLSHMLVERFYRSILGDTLFDLDRNGFEGNFEGNNDLIVNITSQVGGLNSALRVPSNNIIPDESAIYPNTVHSSRVKADQDILDELHSYVIQNDVITLLGSSNNKFADAIGIGSACDIPEQ